MADLKYLTLEEVSQRYRGETSVVNHRKQVSTAMLFGVASGKLSWSATTLRPNHRIVLQRYLA